MIDSLIELLSLFFGNLGV